MTKLKFKNKREEMAARQRLYDNTIKFVIAPQSKKINIIHYANNTALIYKYGVDPRVAGTLDKVGCFTHSSLWDNYFQTFKGVFYIETLNVDVGNDKLSDIVENERNGLEYPIKTSISTWFGFKKNQAFRTNSIADLLENKKYANLNIQGNDAILTPAKFCDKKLFKEYGGAKMCINLTQEMYIDKSEGKDIQIKPFSIGVIGRVTLRKKTEQII